MSTRKIYVVGGDSHYTNWMQGEVVSQMSAADLVVFTGGEDVNPAVYNRQRHPLTMCNPKRDTAELIEKDLAVKMAIPMVGICRGAQFLCACAGGTLVQDQENPSFYHPIYTDDGLTLTMTSTHHQAQLPWTLNDDDYRVLAWTKHLCGHHDGAKPGLEMVYAAMPCENREVEICYYKHIKALAIQGHPEMMWGRRDLNDTINKSIVYCQELLNKLLEGKL